MSINSTSRTILAAGLVLAALGLAGCSSADSEPAPSASLVAEYTIEPTLALTREEAVSKCVAAIKDQYAEPVPGDESGLTSYDRIFGSLEPEVSQEGSDWVVSYTGAEAFYLECSTQGDQVKVALPGY
ncbi:hypothetical protein [Pseudoclavibacter helvolus]|uniref:Lipoprotein n=1 Tax=Pseudoclavibacter helvolus TaxID=255205 RepID=A0A7W4YFE4_9MICO|nr:hypothetical protein [Pseudoclavibacter helvolus]MBB2958217.1 hypothetical protein [Pseudoclavibacter helvolus]